jgi:hypothetical protein
MTFLIFENLYLLILVFEIFVGLLQLIVVSACSCALLLK